MCLGQGKAEFWGLNDMLPGKLESESMVVDVCEIMGVFRVVYLCVCVSCLVCACVLEIMIVSVVWLFGCVKGG